MEQWTTFDDVYAVGEFQLQLHSWSIARRFLVTREPVREGHDSVGRKLVDVPGYTFRVFVTSCGDPPQEIWRDYNRRADMENSTAELKHDLGADGLRLKQFFATEAVASLQLTRRVPAGRRLARLSRAGHDPYSDPHVRRHPRPCRSPSGAAPIGKLGWPSTRIPLLDSILHWQIPTSAKLPLTLLT